MEENKNGRRPKMKTTKMKDDQHERQTKMKDDKNGRQ